MKKPSKAAATQKRIERAKAMGDVAAYLASRTRKQIDAVNRKHERDNAEHVRAFDRADRAMRRAFLKIIPATRCPIIFVSLKIPSPVISDGAQPRSNGSSPTVKRPASSGADADVGEPTDDASVHRDFTCCGRVAAAPSAGCDAVVRCALPQASGTSKTGAAIATALTPTHCSVSAILDKCKSRRQNRGLFASL